MKRAVKSKGRTMVPTIGAIAPVVSESLWPGCLGEYAKCAGRFCGDFYEVCRAMGSGMVTLAVLRYRGNQDAESYPAVMLRYLLDNQGQYVLLAENVLAACRITFNYYAVEFDAREDGARKLTRFKSRAVGSIAYSIDEEHGLMVVRG